MKDVCYSTGELFRNDFLKNNGVFSSRVLLISYLFLGVRAYNPVFSFFFIASFMYSKDSLIAEIR